ncbi:MAG: RNA polymerase sigma factor [Bacteroidales bacterium]
MFKDKLISIQDKMLGYALTLTRNIDQAYDLRQEATLKALQNEKNYTEHNSFAGWIFKIVQNSYINNYNEAIRNRALLEDATNTLINNIYAPNIYSNINREAILERIKAMDDKHKETFMMMMDGYKYHEISEKLGIPIGTVKSRISDTRKFLNTHLAEFREKE